MPEDVFVCKIIEHIRQHDEIYGIARAYDSDTSPNQPWTIDTMRSLIIRITKEGKLPKKNQANHPEVQQMHTRDNTVLQQHICRTHSSNNPDHETQFLYDGEGMWMKHKPINEMERNTHRGYFTNNGNGRSKKIVHSNA